MIAARLGNNSNEAVKKLFDEIAPRFTDRNGGYTRVMKLGPRFGDKAEMALLELSRRVGNQGTGDQATSFTSQHFIA